MVVLHAFSSGSSGSPSRGRWPAGWVAAATVAVLCVSERSAQAYIDPGTGSLIYQALLAGLLGLGFTFRRTYGSITRFMRGRFGNRTVTSEKANPDHV